MKLAWLSILCLCFSLPLEAQHTITVDANLDVTTKSIEIDQTISIYNHSAQMMDSIYLLDWANSFSSKTTPLAKRFAENFKSAFHFEKDENRGRTTVESITDDLGVPISWERGKALDIIRMAAPVTINPGDSAKIKLRYSVTLPEDRFTRYGYDRNGNFKLNYWLITPAVFNGNWQAYSNKNTDDYYQTPSNFRIQFTLPSEYKLFTDLDMVEAEDMGDRQKIRLEGDLRMQTDIYLERLDSFQSTLTDQVEVITDLRDEKVGNAPNALLIDRVTRFLNDRLGPYPFRKLLVSEADYRNSPVYGFNQLPDFISPFPSGFELDMELLKTITREYITNTLHLHPRKDHWLYGAIQIYLMIEYVDTYYPEMKILGSLSEFWVIGWSHASDLEFNDQYPFLYMNMARNNLHQSLITPKDSLVKFNKNIASDYYAGEGFQYLSDYIGKPELGKALRDYFNEFKLKPTSPEEFRKVLEQNTQLPVNWFFDEFVAKRTTIDFKIKKVKEVNDSLEVTILNKRNNSMPVSLYVYDRDALLFKRWTSPIDSLLKIRIPKENVHKLVLNAEGVIPEYNRRNNTKKVRGLFNKPIQFRLFQDVEDPNYTQLFFMPDAQYNLYDGFILGPKLYNKTFLPRGVHYKIVPQYGFRSQKLIGKGSMQYTINLDKNNHYSTRMGVSGSFFSYNRNLFYKRVTPFLVFAFRDNDDLRKNKKQFINIRSVNVFRDEDPNDPDQDPNYSIFNVKYVYSDKNLINYYRGVMDYQITKSFSKVSAQFDYRKLFNNNRQLNIRFYAGTFIYNKTSTESDFFSFALDRPSDYLFDYNYYGRSEDTGLFSQQLIIAEGGFKSQLEPSYANQYIATLNASTNIWKWIFAYGDIGVVKNEGVKPKGVWDTGIRASLVADYFEIYFPLYSNLGWEPGLGNYDQRIRFIVTLDIQTLLGLFTREWY